MRIIGLTLRHLGQINLYQRILSPSNTILSLSTKKLHLAINLQLAYF